MTSDNRAVISRNDYFAKVPNWISDLVPRGRLSWSDVGVYVCLERHNGQDCFPGQALLGKEAGLSERQVRRALERLDEVGAIRVEQRPGVSGRRNRYVLAGSEPLRRRSSGPNRTLMTGSNRTSVSGSNRTPMSGELDQVELDVENAYAFPSDAGQTHSDDPEPAPLPMAPPAGGRVEVAVPAKPRKADELFDALVKAVGLEPAELTNGARGAVNRALRDLRQVGATPDDIRQRALEYHRRMPSMTLSAVALAKHWPTLGAPPPEQETPVISDRRRQQLAQMARASAHLRNGGGIWELSS